MRLGTFASSASSSPPSARFEPAIGEYRISTSPDARNDLDLWFDDEWFDSVVQQIILLRQSRLAGKKASDARSS